MNRGRGNRVWVVLSLCLLFLSTFTAVSQAESAGAGLKSNPSNAQYNCAAISFEFEGYATVVDMGDWMFLNQTVLNSCVGNTNVIMFAVWKVASGQTVAVETAGVNLTAGETVNFYVPVFNISPGVYTVYLFGISEGNIPVSLVQQVQITIN